MQKLVREDFGVESQRKAKQQKVFRILNTVVGRAHWIDGIPKIVFELVKVQLT